MPLEGALLLYVINKAPFCYNGHRVPLFGPATVVRETADERSRCTMTKSSVSLEGETLDILQTLACLEVWGVHRVKQEVMCDSLFAGGEAGRRGIVWTPVISRFLRFVSFCFLW